MRLSDEELRMVRALNQPHETMRRMATELLELRAFRDAVLAAHEYPMTVQVDASGVPAEARDRMRRGLAVGQGLADAISTERRRMGGE